MTKISDIIEKMVLGRKKLIPVARPIRKALPPRRNLPALIKPRFKPLPRPTLRQLPSQVKTMERPKTLPARKPKFFSPLPRPTLRQLPSQVKTMERIKAIRKRPTKTIGGKVLYKPKKIGAIRKPIPMKKKVTARIKKTRLVGATSFPKKLERTPFG